MKNKFFSAIVMIALGFSSFTVQAATPSASANELKKEIAGLMKKKDLTFLKENVEMVSVEFLINAKNELVILHVDGQHETTCDEIKKMLEFQSVRYEQPRQLMRYKVNLRLVKSDKTA